MPTSSVCRTLLLFLLSTTPPALLAQRDRILGPVDLGRPVTLKGNVHPAAQSQFDRGLVAPSLELGYVSMMLKQSADQQAALDQLLADQQERSSPKYHKWLTPELYADRFGLSRADIAKIVSWLESQGLKVNGVARGRLWIAFGGTAEQISRAFRTEIHRYRVDGETHFAIAMEPSIPAALANIVAGFQGLDDFRMKSSTRMKRVAAGPSHPQVTLADGSHLLAPDDLATIYNIAPLYNAGIDGTGQRIVIAGGSTIDLTSIQLFRQKFNLPPNDPQLVLVGPDPGSNSGLFDADLDGYLDTEWAGALARNATIIYVYSLSPAFSVQYAVDQNLATVISFSFGGCEPNQPSQFQNIFRSIAQQGNAEGITLIASSGDSGAAGCDMQGMNPRATKGLAVNVPASFPEVTGVGGTQFNEGDGNYWSTANSDSLASAMSYIPETSWNENGAGGLDASGGGPSILFPKPLWQAGPGVPNDNARDVPDVSLAAAGGHDGYFVVFGALSGSVGGSSAAAPAFAGIVGLLNQYLISNGSLAQPGLGNINPVLYRLAKNTTNVFHDITTGDNIVPCAQGTPDCSTGSFGYKAGPGYDLVTGLGSVDVNNLITQWDNRTGSTSTTLTANPGSVVWGGAVQLTATVTASGATPTGTVSFNSNDQPLGEVLLSGSGGTATAKLKLNSSEQPVGTNTISVLYSGDGKLDGSSASVTVSVSAPAGSSVIPIVTPNPVYKQPPDSDGASWLVNLTLQEVAGIAATLTGFAIDGATLPVSTFFPGGTAIPANGTLNGGLGYKTLTVPATHVLGFSGVDANGKTWSQQVPVFFLGPPLPASTTTTLTGIPNTLVWGSTLQVTATVTASGGAGTPSGTVSFNAGNTLLGSASLTGSGGTATAQLTVNTSQLPVGVDTISALYGGDNTFNGSPDSVTFTVSAPPGSSLIPIITPNPVYQQPPDANGISWPLNFVLQEVAGIASTLTGLTIDDATLQISTYFPGGTSIPANGTLRGGLGYKTLTVPATHTFGFSGIDAQGNTWTQQVPVVFLGPVPK
jgi:hypothetical protein